MAVSNHDVCEGLGGEYTVIFQGATQLTLEVAWDECMQRVAIANDLQMELLTN